MAEVPQARRYAERFRAAAALADTGVAIKRQSLRDLEADLRALLADPAG